MATRMFLFVMLVVLIAAALIDSADGSVSDRRRPLSRYFEHPSDRMTIENMTCNFLEQPLDHFAPNSPTYLQRYCFYDYGRGENSTPIFFYTGNESPIEQYINFTGLIWEFAPDLDALVVFAEHRYEGHSLPSVSTHCMSHCSSKQALADFARLLDITVNPGSARPVIAFGGSYGGMLSAWLRFKYPGTIAGAIAASAPIWGFPRQNPTRIDAASRVIARAMQQPYPPDAEEPHPQNQCAKNFKAGLILMRFLGASEAGRALMSRALRLCTPLQGANETGLLLDWASSPWFAMAEGSFPYPSSYITFSLGMGLNNLPPWPQQHACWNASNLAADLGVSIVDGSEEEVDFVIQYGEDLTLKVDWDNVTVVSAGSGTSEFLSLLLENVRDAVGVWFNLTQDLPCFNVTPAISLDSSSKDDTLGVSTKRDRSLSSLREDPSGVCLEKIKAEGSWPSLCCNEDINMVITYSSGLGKDMFWPPSEARGTHEYQQVNVSYGFCDDPDGLFGYPLEHDLESKWLDIFYGGLRIGSFSNIVFSNGLLDPWSSGGVYKEDPHVHGFDGEMVQNLTEDGSMIAVIMEYGGHHTDLMYSHPNDPECITKGRQIEREHIMKWINQWNSQCRNSPK